MATFRWPAAEVSINRAELGSRIGNRVQDGMTREKAWAKELDCELRRGLQIAAKNKLMQDKKESVGLLLPLLGIYSTTFNFLTGNEFWLGVDLAAFYLMPMAFGGLVNVVMSGKSLLERRRWSIFPGAVQPDRFALAALASFSLPLVRPIEASKSSKQPEQ